MFERASDLVSEWKEANGTPLLAPEASRDLAGRIMLALIEAQTEVALATGAAPSTIHPARGPALPPSDHGTFRIRGLCHGGTRRSRRR
jgi:hypothetical protein